MRRLGVIISTIGAAATLGVMGATGAAASGGPHGVLKGTTWTVEAAAAGACESDLFGAHLTFAGTDHPMSSGTWSRTRKTVSLSWTAGAFMGFTFSGTYSLSSNSYTGTLNTPAGGQAATLVSGAVTGC